MGKTDTMMLPGWEIEADKQLIIRALKFANYHRQENYYEVIGYMGQSLKDLQASLDKAKPTKQEAYYGPEKEA
jgi:hypothetical protein